MLLSWDLPCLFSLAAGFLSLTSSDPGKNANQKCNRKRKSAKTNCLLFISLFCPPLLFTDTESENESVKSFPASTLFDQIKLCVLFDWNWIVVKGQGGENIRSTCASSIFDSKST